MKVMIDLLALVGAEKTYMNGVPGVFIPEMPNIRMTKLKSRWYAFTSFLLWPCVTKKTYDMKGYQQLPPEVLDRCLSDPKMAKKRDKAIWGWSDAGTPSSYVLSEDFERVLNEE